MIVKHYRDYRLGFARPLAEADQEQLIRSLERPDEVADDPLKGRAQADYVNFSGWGEVVVKHYIRGGWMRYLSHRRHLRSRASRGEKELRILLALRKAGFPVPEPLGWAERGRIFVQNWLVMAKIPDTRTLAEVAQSKPSEAQELLGKVTALIDRLTKERVHHVDLHPGNVLIDTRNQVYLIDFDKAAYVALTPVEIRDRIYRRWNRAITKHGLPANLTLTPSPQIDQPPRASASVSPH